MTDVIAEEVKSWLDVLTSATMLTQAALKANPFNEEELRENFEDMLLAQRKIESFRPKTAKANTYQFEKAIPALLNAERLAIRVHRKLPEVEPLHQSPTTTIVNNSRKIPAVEVPTFGGEITEFANFMTAFDMKFGELAISKREKLLQLRNVVTGGPAQLISSLAITDNNFDVAINLLKGKYDNEREVIADLYHKLDQVPVANSKSFVLENTYYQIAGILNALVAHGKDIDDDQPLLENVRDKYPFHILQQVCGNKELTLTKLHEEISLYVAQKVKHDKRRAGKNAQHNTQRENHENHQQHGVTSLFAVNKNETQHTQRKGKNQHNRGTKAMPSSTPPAKVVPPCVFCSEIHYSSACSTHTTADIRRSLLKNRCHLCLKADHVKSQCRTTISCYYCKQVNDHNSALCPTQFPGKSPPPNDKKATDNAEKEKKTVMFVRSHRGAHATVLVTVQDPTTNKKQKIRALLDNGSNESYITETAARRLGLQLTNTRNVPVNVFLKDSPVNLRTSTTSLIVSNDADLVLHLVTDTSPTIPQQVQLFDHTEFRKLYPQYDHLEYIDQARDRPIELLMGSDYYYDIVSDKSRITDGLYLQNTKFGWMLVGRKKTETENKSTYFQMAPSEAIKQLCELDSIGIAELPLSAIAEEERALEQFYSNLTFTGTRYRIRWPWRSDPPNLKQNFGLAVGRLKSLQKRLTEKTFAEYNNILTTQITTGILDEIENCNISKVKHFLPHHVIASPEKSTPIRIVFDGSAKTNKNERSINDEIYKGLNLLADGAKIIIRWRLHPIILVSDLEKAFHQLEIDDADTYYVCLLWLYDFTKPPTGKNLRILRFLRVVFGITASPFLLHAVISFHLNKFAKKYPKIIKKLRRDGFVDNFVTGFCTREEAIEFYKISIKIFASCSMNLRKWASNDENIRVEFQQSDKSPSISILGILWDQYKDNFKLKSLDKHENITLRTILSTTAQVYDPCGWYAPTTLLAKLFLREIHPVYGWDDTLAQEHEQQWNEIRSELESATENTSQRFQYDMEDKSTIFSLHVFTDASIKACACAVYLRIQNKQNETKSYLVLAKTKLAKINNIPKLELIAVLMGVQALKYIRDAIQLDTKSYLWCDSKCVLSWIATQKILPVFIEKQVQKINNISHLEKRYVPSTHNAADIASRGAKFDELTSKWFEGPEWLAQNESNWPPHVPITALNVEIPNELTPKTTVLITAPVKPPFEIKLEEYSSYLRLLRVTTYAMRFVSKSTYAKHKEMFQSTSNHDAQQLWIRQVQKTHYAEVLEAIKNKKHHPLITKLNLSEDKHGIIRCVGRFKYAPLSQYEKSPILLPSPKDSLFTKLLVQYYHVTMFHAGVNQTLTSLRRKFWIISGRRAIYSIIRSCEKCKRFTARSYQQPQISDLPNFRLEDHVTPFTKIGIDTFGPLWSSNEKRYVLLVTDLVIRAVDVELLDDMTTEKTLLALRTIFARRTTPNLVISDNAPQFLALQQSFEKSFSHEWSWKFIPEHSPWMGGVYERMVKLIKNAIFKTYHNVAITDYVLRASLAEIVHVINNRPLTIVTDTDAKDDLQPLTPNHFLQGYYLETISPINNADTTDVTPTVHQLITIARCCESNKDRFWAIWRVNYLQHLREKGFYKNKLFSQRPTLTSPKVGAVVLISEKLQKRGQWKLGKIVQLISSSDGKIRAAKLKTAIGMLVRPVHELYPLEITDQEHDDEWDTPEITVQVISDSDSEDDVNIH